MKDIKIENIGVTKIDYEDQKKINGGHSIFYWIGYAMGMLAGENEKLVTENSQYIAMTRCFSH